MRQRTLLGIAVVSFLVLSALPSITHAQSEPLSPLAPRCPAGTTPPVDTSTVRVGLWPSDAWRARAYGEADQLRMREYADVIRQYFVPPASLGELPILAESYAAKDKDLGQRAAVGGRIVLVVTRAGRIRKVAWEQIPLAAPFARAIADAVMRADSSGAFAGISRARNATDTLSLIISSRRGELPAGAALLLLARLEAYVVDRPVFVRTLKLPAYPENARRNRAENTGEVAFVVGSDDRAYMPSFQVIRTDYSDFVPGMRTAVAESIFEAARSGGCMVPQLVVQPFGYALRY